MKKHAPTRQRYSLTSVTHSDEDAIRRELLGFEMMFRAEKEKCIPGLECIRRKPGLGLQGLRGNGELGVLYGRGHPGFLGEVVAEMAAWGHSSTMGDIRTRCICPWAHKKLPTQMLGKGVRAHHARRWLIYAAADKRHRPTPGGPQKVR